MRRIVLGLGANLGDREATIKLAIKTLAERLNLGEIRISSTHESKALLPEGAPAEWDIDFLNLVISGDFDDEDFNDGSVCDAAKLCHYILDEVKKIEVELGRKKRDHWAPREIDIDILAIEGVKFSDERIQIPHSQIQKRQFVYQPFSEIEYKLISALNF